MHRFNINGWKYGESRIEDLAQQVKRAHPGANLVTDAGGKVFGLSLAVALFSKLFMIPIWFGWTAKQPSPKPTDLMRVFGTCVFVRSNALDEDWIDPAAGLHQSKQAGLFSNYEDVLNRLLSTAGGVVLQKTALCDLGLVVDVVWSELLARNVIRVAIGRPSRTGVGLKYTSPTWDNEAFVGLFDAQTGEAIVDLQVGYFDVHRFVQTIVEEVVPRLERAGLNFGLQFEFMTMADFQHLQPKHINLLQIRPSPGSMQGECELPGSTGTPLVTTGKVNGRGSVTAPVYFVCGYNHRDPLESSWKLHIAGQQGTHFDELEAIKALIVGKIVLWGEGALARYGGSFYQVLGAWRLGAVAQLSGHAVFINSAHGSILPTYRTDELIRPVFEEARGTGLLVSIGSDAVWELRRFLREAPVSLQVLSDGIVGQVYKI